MAEVVFQLEAINAALIGGVSTDLLPNQVEYLAFEVEVDAGDSFHQVAVERSCLFDQVHLVAKGSVWVSKNGDLGF